MCGKVLKNAITLKIFREIMYLFCNLCSKNFDFTEKMLIFT